MNHIPVASIDGYGERDDIALARDLQEGVKRDNARRPLPDPEYSWGTELNGAESIVDLVLEILRRGLASMLGDKSDIYWPVDIESISEAVGQACIIEGLDEDVYAPTMRCDGFRYEIRLY